MMDSFPSKSECMYRQIRNIYSDKRGTPIATIGHRGIIDFHTKSHSIPLSSTSEKRLERRIWNRARWRYRVPDYGQRSQCFEMYIVNRMRQVLMRLSFGKGWWPRWCKECIKWSDIPDWWAGIDQNQNPIQSACCWNRYPENQLQSYSPTATYCDSGPFLRFSHLSTYKNVLDCNLTQKPYCMGWEQWSLCFSLMDKVRKLIKFVTSGWPWARNKFKNVLALSVFS